MFSVAERWEAHDPEARTGGLVMSNDDWLRQQTQQSIINNPSIEKPTEQQVPDYHDRTVIQNEHDRMRREDEERRNRQSW